MLIFLIEDDEALAEGISFMLEKEGYETERFSACSDSRRALEQTQPDLILLDSQSAGWCTGLCFAVKYQKSGRSPILMITARDMEIDQVMCLGKRSGRLYCETIFTGSFKGKDCGAPSQAGRTVGKSRAAYLRADPCG